MRQSARGRSITSKMLVHCMLLAFRSLRTPVSAENVRNWTHLAAKPRYDPLRFFIDLFSCLETELKSKQSISSTHAVFWLRFFTISNSLSFHCAVSTENLVKNFCGDFAVLAPFRLPAHISLRNIRLSFACHQHDIAVYS